MLFSKNKSLYIYAVFSVFVLGSFLFPCKKREMKKAIYVSKTILERCLYTPAFFLEHAPYMPSVWTEWGYWWWLFWYFWRWVLLHHNNQITKKGQSWISLYYSAVWRDMHSVKIIILIQSKAGIGLNSLIPDVMDMLCLLITLIHNQFWMCIDSNDAYLGYWFLEKLFSLHS